MRRRKYDALIVFNVRGSSACLCGNYVNQRDKMDLTFNELCIIQNALTYLQLSEDITQSASFLRLLNKVNEQIEQSFRRDEE